MSIIVVSLYFDSDANGGGHASANGAQKQQRMLQKNFVVFASLLFFSLLNVSANVFGVLSFQPRVIPQDHSSSSMADGCYHVFMDLGANLGVHGRFLFEPEKYPNATIAKEMFNSQFGTRDTRDNRDICVFAFEPNPIHKERHQKLQETYQELGWRYIPMPVGVGDLDGNLTFYRQDDQYYEEWGFGMQQITENATTITIPMIRFANFLNEHIEHRKQPSEIYGIYESGPKVVMKMDIEATEFHVMPDLITSGALCSTVDFVFGEIHARHAFFPLVTRANETLLYKRQATNLFQAFLRTMNASASCKTIFADNDDESYLHDCVPMPSSSDNREV